MNIVEKVNKIVTRYKFNKHTKIMDSLETIDFIKQNKCSVARYGDGEFMIAFDNFNTLFQESSKSLSYHLRRVLEENDAPDKLLVCIPYIFKSTKGVVSRSKKFWFKRKYHFSSYLYEIESKRDISIFGDSFITRPYMDYQDYNRAKIIFDKLKDLWEGQNILIVEGSETRLGVGNDLYDNAKSICRIICPSKGAFDKYDEIYESVLKFAGDDLVLIALGPAATVLAADLAKKNIWAIDIGHIDIEYEWFLRNAKEKIKIEGKYVNEVAGGNVVSDCLDEKYLSEIVERI